jgi:hypothetical protein
MKDFRRVAANSDMQSLRHARANSPLLRSVDRTDTRVHRAVVTMMVLLAPLAVWMSIITWNSQESAAAETAAATQVVEATTLADAPTFANAASEYTTPPSLTVSARWTVDGQRHDGMVVVPAGSPAGTKTNITVESATGMATSAAPTGADVVIVSLFMGIVTWIVGAGLLLGILWSVRRHLDRCRDALWDDAIFRFFS